MSGKLVYAMHNNEERGAKIPDDDHDELNAQRIQGVPEILVQEIAFNLPSIDAFFMIFLILLGYSVGEWSKGAKGGRNDRRLRQTVKVYLPSSSSYTNSDYGQ